jgi:hypothetical protein
MNVYPGFILVAIAVVLRMLVKMIEDEEYVRGVQDTLAVIIDEVGKMNNVSEVDD